MSQGPENYSGKLTAAEEAHIMTLTSPTDIADYIHQLELGAGLRVEDPMNNNILHEIDRSQVVPSTVTVKIGDKTFTGTQAEVDTQMLAAFRAQQNQPPAADAARDSNGRFSKEQPRTNPTPRLTEGADKIAGDLITNALAAQGISIDDLKEVVAGPASDRTAVTSWAEATEAFKNATPDYPGGEHMVELIGNKIAELGLHNKPSAASIKKAYEAVQADADQYVALRDAKTPEEIRAILGTSERERDRARAGYSY
jgi:hypothetical protein